MNYYCAFYTDKYNKTIQKLYVKNKRSFRNLKNFEKFFPTPYFLELSQIKIISFSEYYIRKFLQKKIIKINS